MTRIIRLNREVSPSEPCEPAPDVEQCEIIIFPGVRYERWDQGAASDHSNAQVSGNKLSDRSIERDWLDI